MKLTLIFRFFLLGITLLLSSVLFYAEHVANLKSELEAFTASINEIHEKLDMVHAAVLLAQKSQRGYLLTQDDQYLNNYRVAKAELLQLLPSLNSSVASNTTKGEVDSTLKENTQTISELWWRLSAELAQTIELAQAGQLTAAIQIVRSNVGLNFANNIGRVIAETQDRLRAEQTIVAQSLAQSEKVQHLLIWWVCGLVFSAFALFWVVVRQRVIEPFKRITEWLSLNPGSRNSPLQSDQGIDPDVTQINQALIDFRCKFEEKAAEQLALANKQLQQQTEYTAVLAHEIRTPLNTVIGLLEKGRFDGSITTDAMTARTLDDSTTNLMTLVNSALDYQRLREGRYQIEPVPIHADGFVQSLTASAKFLAGAEKITIAASNTVSPELLIMADAAKVRQILTNLLSNAVKFTPIRGNITLTSHLEKSGDKTHWILSVFDTGIGLSSEGITRLFKPFSQASEGANRKFGGTGLGLALSREIAHAMGGSIAVQSKLKQGSEFTLRIPVETIKDEGQLEGVLGKADDLDNFKLDLSGKTILMVEDHALNAKINSALLRKQTGCDIENEATAESAIDQFKRGFRCDLILMDINLGEGMTGLEASQYLNALLGDRAPPIIALTAGVLESEKQRVYEAGMSGFLGKPFNEKTVKKVLRPFFPECLRAIPSGEEKQAY